MSASIIRPHQIAGYRGNLDPQLADLDWRHETGIQAPILQILGNAPTVSSIALAPGQCFDLRRIHQQQPESLVFQNIPHTVRQ